MRDSDLDRLWRAAASPDTPDPAPPFGFETRVVALLRSARGENAARDSNVLHLLRRTMWSAAFVTILVGTAAYWQLNANEEDGEPLTNAYAIADNEIETGFFQ